MRLEAQPVAFVVNAQVMEPTGATVVEQQTPIPGRDESERDEDDTPDTPPTEPPPIPVEDPPAEPGPQGPYLARH